jgi:HipA-like protein
VTTLAVNLDQQQAGILEQDPHTNRFAFSYSAGWLDYRGRYSLTPHLPLRANAAQTAEAHSTAVRQFFENLLPEGRALDEAAAVNHVSKANLVGLMVALGRGTHANSLMRMNFHIGFVHVRTSHSPYGTERYACRLPDARTRSPSSKRVGNGILWKVCSWPQPTF